MDKDLDKVSKAKDIFLKVGYGSTSLLQRELKISYNRARRIMEILELAKFIGPARGSKPRKLMIREKKELLEKVQDHASITEFWKLKSNVGRKKIFQDPDVLWQQACIYFEWMQNNPLMQVDFRGKDADEVEIPKMRPFTISGLCLFLGVSRQYFRDFDYKGDPNEEQFSLVIERIKDTIYNQKFEGAAAGFLNANIISRDLGLQEKTHHSIDDKRKSTGDLFPFEADGTLTDGEG